MQILEYPYIVIAILLFVGIILGAIGLYFALCGIKAAKETEEIDFVSLNKLENLYDKFVKNRKRRSVIYIGVSLDIARSVYSDLVANNIFSDIKPIILKAFMSDGTFVAPCDNKNFVALGPASDLDAERLIKMCDEKIDDCLLGHKALNIALVRFGIYEGVASDVSFDEAITRAKMAYTIAEDNNTTFERWSTHAGKAVEKRIKIENNIENEIDNNRFFLEYQPVLDAKTKKIAGAEVLSRLNSESEGILTPGSFLSAVSSVGLSTKFDYYIFEKNCKWIANDKKLRGKYVYTTNFSRTTLSDSEFAEKITSIAEKYGLSLSSIAIEILEDKSISGEMLNVMTENLKKLKEKGVLILLDDFGSGFTSFGDLQNFKIDIVKIDKSITQNALSETGFVILKNVIATAKDLGYKTVCEGIETSEHEERAIKAGCDLLQGYYYHKPMPVSKLEKLLEEDK